MNQTPTPPPPSTWERDPVAYELTWTWRDAPPTETPMVTPLRATSVQRAIRQLVGGLAEENGADVSRAVIVLDAVRV